MRTLAGNTSWKPPTRKKGRPPQPPRPADSYRAARKRAERGNPRSLLLREERLLTGETRRDMDRRREETRRQRYGE